MVTMTGFWTTFLAELAERASGPMWPRLVLQPLVTAFLAIRSGLRDAKEGRPPYFWALVSDSAHRVEVLRDGWKVLGRLRQHPDTSQIPVIVCTILPQEDLAFSLGASAYLRKPLKRADFLAALDRVTSPASGSR